MKYQVIEKHEPNNSNAIKVEKGEKVRLGRLSHEEDGWKDWIYCYSLDDNREGWTPVQIVQIDNEYGIILSNYWAKELKVSKGDKVYGELELNGWLWCSRLDDSEVGWLPKEKMVILFED